MSARFLLFQEHYGVHIRAAERIEKQREAAYAEQYAASARALQQRQATE